MNNKNLWSQFKLNLKGLLGYITDTTYTLYHKFGDKKTKAMNHNYDESPGNTGERDSMLFHSSQEAYKRLFRSVLHNIFYLGSVHHGDRRILLDNKNNYFKNIILLLKNIENETINISKYNKLSTTQRAYLLEARWFMMSKITSLISHSNDKNEDKLELLASLFGDIENAKGLDDEARLFYDHQIENLDVYALTPLKILLMGFTHFCHMQISYLCLLEADEQILHIKSQEARAQLQKKFIDISYFTQERIEFILSKNTINSLLDIESEKPAFKLTHDEQNDIKSIVDNLYGHMTDSGNYQNPHKSDIYWLIQMSGCAYNPGQDIHEYPIEKIKHPEEFYENTLSVIKHLESPHPHCPQKLRALYDKLLRLNDGAGILDT